MACGNLFCRFASKDETAVGPAAHCMVKVEGGALWAAAMERDARFSEGKRRREQKEGL